MKTYNQFINEATIGDFYKNQVEIFLNNDKEDKQLFIDCKKLGSKILEDASIILKCKNYVILGYKDMGYDKLTNNDVELKYYNSENVIVGIIPDGINKIIGKTGQSVSMRKINMILFEKSQWTNDIENWIIHEVGHVISWRDYKDTPKIKINIGSGKFGSNDPVFDAKYCFGSSGYPNVWSEYIPFTNQIKSLLKNNSPDKVIRLIMTDYEKNHKDDLEMLKQDEQIFINYLNIVSKNKVKIKNKYEIY